MSRKLAIKRLTASDLTLFKWHFQNRPAGKQKAINMDARVFVHTLYPGLPETVLSLPGNRIPLDLSLYGPGITPVHNIQRKILKQEKNWRLDGEYIDNPDEAPSRYNSLREGDLAVLEFAGAPIPVAMRVVLVSTSSKEDTALHVELTKLCAGASMIAVEPAALESAIERASPSEMHPILDWVDGAAVEDAGVQGEELLNTHFETLKEKKKIQNFKWVSQENAISPYDFLEISAGQPVRKVDAKSTSGGFSNPIHVSLGELIESQGDIPYDIGRLYEVREGFARLRVARDVKATFKRIVETIGQFPKGVSPDGLSIDPELLKFGDETIIKDEGEV